MKELTFDLDDSYFELKKPEQGMIWVGTCLYCAEDVPIGREDGTTLRHMKPNGEDECEWDIEPAELNREEVSENYRSCKEHVAECKRSIREIKTHFGRSFTDRDMERSYPSEISELKDAEQELLIAQRVKEKIKGKTGKPERRLKQIAAPPEKYGTCQFCLESVPLTSNQNAVPHGFIYEDEGTLECEGCGETPIEGGDEAFKRHCRERAIEVLAREMALERDLIDDDNLTKFNRHLDRCRDDVEELTAPYRNKNREIVLAKPISSAEIKTRALEVAYKQQKRDDAIARWPDMADFTYEARKARESNVLNVSTKEIVKSRSTAHEAGLPASAGVFFIISMLIIGFIAYLLLA